ncbi:DUF7507 domain-containing protein [Agrococcus jejuensis]|uniref:LPXTG-motif cell wall anchor domain-containing protein/conserved repeat domain-containing protein n=1 Tax=Agrococcus jejuensis TaxID=399736 RepID=A0A1G8E7T7_9MICO|nr:LPXTG cell wall anchor domain-containing protein [Agrococcus jejuensis]SDH65750.1 LPXTG-motif cell wall anchor domain-containing protein/conserved repeat domain-containing protein [Agrococcus jejuensis]
MRIRTASATAIVAALGVALAAPAAAQAAPVAIAPRFASSAAAPAGSWAGLEPAGTDGVARTTAAITGSTAFTLQVHEPAGATGRVLDPALDGTVALAVTPLSAGAAGTTGATAYFDPAAPTSAPNGWPGANDVLTSGFAVEQGIQTWAFSYAFDFSGLAGGVLPAGSRIAVSDVDVCQSATVGGIDERFAATSSATGPWLDYQYRVVVSGSQPTPTPTVTFDADTGGYAITPQCVDRGMTEVLVTTQPVSTLTLELANRQGAGVTRFGLLLPTSAPAPGIQLVKTTDGQDVAAAPGPRLVAGEPVDYGFAVTNSGTTDLASVTVTDDRVDAAAIDCGDGTNVIPLLPVGATVDCAATGTVVVGQHANTATATGLPVDSRGAPVAGAASPSAQDSSWHLGVVDPSASIATSASTGEAQPGETVTFTTTVGNTGVTTLDGAVVEAPVPDGFEVTDAGGGVVTDGGASGSSVRWEVGELAAGETATLTLTGVVRETQPGAVLELRASGSASVGETTVALQPVEACVDDETASCAVVTVAAVAPPSTAPPTTTPSTPPSTPPSVDPGASGTLPATGSDLAPVAWIVAMATLLVGLGVVLRRRTR